MHPLAFAGTLAVEQSEHDTVGEQQARGGVVDCDSDPHRALPGMAGDRHEASHALGDLVDAGPAGIGPVLPKAGDAAIDDARVDLPHRFVIDAEPVLHVGFVILDDHIGALGELHKDRVALIAFEVQRNSPLVAMQVLEIGTVAAAAGRVDQLAGGLDLDHLRTPIGELAHRRRPGAMRSQVDDEEVVEGEHGHWGIFSIRISSVILRRKIGDYNRDRRSDILAKPGPSWDI